MTFKQFKSGMDVFLTVARNFFYGKTEKEIAVMIKVYYQFLKDMPAKKFEFAIGKIVNQELEIKNSVNFVFFVRQKGRGYYELEDKRRMLSDGELSQNKKKIKSLVHEGKFLKTIEKVIID